MQHHFRMYPRGFLGDVNNAPVVRNAEGDYNILRTLRNAEPGPTQYKALGAENQELTKLYVSLVKQPYLMDSFDFREQCLRAVLKAFGCNSVMTWVEAQNRSPYFGKYHQAMINDMVRFAWYGRPREQANSTWDMLVDGTENFESNFKWDKDLEGIDQYLKFNNVSWVEFIHDWTCQPGGFSDMMITAFILFGARRRDMLSVR